MANTVDFKVVIPARYGSSRLPGKPIIEIAGRPLIQYVYERACASGAHSVVIATDDERVRLVCASFGADVRMTAPAHASGTSRIAEVITHDADADETIIVNVQGDEPLIPPRLIEQVARNLDQHPDAEIATLCEAIENDADVFDPSVVKVVLDARGFALYFSRAPIPWYRDAFATQPYERPAGACHYRHVGIYAYRVGYLRRYVATPVTEIEQAEALEQLRALHDGARIHVALATEAPGIGVDTPQDLEEFARVLSAV